MTDARSTVSDPPYPLREHLGFDLTDWREGQAQVSLPLRPFLMNRLGLPHGGIHATLLDTAMGYAGCFTGAADRPLFALTLSLTVNYLDRPADAASALIARAERTGGGRSTFFARGILSDDTGRVLAEGSGVFRYRTERG